MAKKKIESRQDLPFYKMADPFKDMEEILGGVHPFKIMYGTLPVSCHEVDTFEGYLEYVKRSPISMEKRKESMDKHLRNVLYGIEQIEQDCRYARAVLDEHRKRLHKDYMEAKYCSEKKRITKKREQNENPITSSFGLAEA